MRKEKALIDLLDGLVHLLAEESKRNPVFANKLDVLLSDLPERKSTSKKTSLSLQDPLPDVHAEWRIRGEGDFRLWLRSQPLPVLRAIVRAEDLDAARRTAKWKEAVRVAEFIADSLKTRQSRGAAFIGRGATE